MKKMTSIEFIYVFIHTFIYFTHCAGGMPTEFMVTGCLWGARVGKRTEQVEKKGGLKVFVTISLLVWFFEKTSKPMNSEEKVN